MSAVPRFSIVIPACNVAAYLDRTLDSVRCQTFMDFECLAVSEESTDDTWAKLDRAAAEDPRIKVVKLPRSGSASVSRNYGIDHATGEYLIFIDGDDWMEKDALERFAAAIDAHRHLDIIAAEYVNWRMDDNGTPVKIGGEKSLNHPGMILTGPAALTEFLRDHTWRVATWRNLYRREFLLATGLKQSPGRRHQDDEWTPRVMFAAQTVLVSGIVYYNYLKRAESITTCRSPASVTDTAKNLATALRFWVEHHAEFSPELAGLLAKQYVIMGGRFAGPRWCGAFPRELRREALALALGDSDGRRAWRSLLWHTGPRDRVFGWILCAAQALPPMAFRVAELAYRLIYRLGE